MLGHCRQHERSVPAMREALEKEFAALEEEKGACLLSAAKSGSRAGRFASCGVRFVPMHEHAWLLRREKGRDASEWKSARCSMSQAGRWQGL